LRQRADALMTAKKYLDAQVAYKALALAGKGEDKEHAQIAAGALPLQTEQESSSQTHPR